MSDEIGVGVRKNDDFEADASKPSARAALMDAGRDSRSTGTSSDTLGAPPPAWSLQIFTSRCGLMAVSAATSRRGSAAWLESWSTCMLRRRWASSV
jgi:hypothetical protein